MPHPHMLWPFGSRHCRAHMVVSRWLVPAHRTVATVPSRRGRSPKKGAAIWAQRWAGMAAGGAGAQGVVG
eukprot:6693305-Alexandrium_andersonii.AAC.1